MKLTHFFSSAFVFPNMEGSSKKRVLENAAGLIAGQLAEVSETQIFDSLINRERLGSTAVGDGVAIPHCREVALSQPAGALFTLEQGVDFDAPDKQPVDLMFVLLVPQEATEEHLQILGQIAQRFSQTTLRESLRSNTDPQQLFQLFIGSPE